MIKLNPLHMRFRITFQEQINTKGTDGLMSSVWTDIEGMESVAASIVGLSGKELQAVGQSISQYNARITIYKQNNVNTSNRILHNGLVYDIIDIIPDPTNQLYFTLMCKTGFTNG